MTTPKDVELLGIVFDASFTHAHPARAVTSRRSRGLVDDGRYNGSAEALHRLRAQAYNLGVPILDEELGNRRVKHKKEMERWH